MESVRKKNIARKPAKAIRAVLPMPGGPGDRHQPSAARGRADQTLDCRQPDRVMLPNRQHIPLLGYYITPAFVSTVHGSMDRRTALSHWPGSAVCRRPDP